MSKELDPETIYLAGGSAHPELAAGIAEAMGVAEGPVKRKRHPNGERYTRFQESVRGKHVFIIQPHVGVEASGDDPGMTVNDAVMEQCLMIDAAMSSSAAEVTAVTPYLSYLRQERKSKGRESIGSRVVINQLTGAGADRIVAVDMHAPGAQAIFRGPFDHLTAQPALRRAMQTEIDGQEDECVVVAPDAGAGKLAERHRRELGLGLLHLAKNRDPQDNQKIQREEKVPEADGRVCLVFDDMIDTAGTLVSAAEALKNSGAKRVLVAASHGIFSEPAIERLQDAPIDRIIVSDTFPQTGAHEALGSKLRVVSVAPIIGQALREIIIHGSVSDIFDDQNHM